MTRLDLPTLLEPERRLRLLQAALAALGVCLLVALFSPDRFFQSYLFGFVYWTGISLGCLAILMIHHLTGGGWGLLTRRYLEAAARSLPMAALLFVPIALGLRTLYVWARPEAVLADPLLAHKAVWLNVPAFLGRAAFCFAVWWWLAWRLTTLAAAVDSAPHDARLGHRLRRASALGLVALALTVSFATFDWTMSIEPAWYSTIYAPMVGVGMILGAWALTLVLLSVGPPESRPASLATPQVLIDAGNLQLAFLMVWTYLAFSQFLLIWSANLPEEIGWYLARTSGGWQWVAVFLAVALFALPFLTLLARSVKRDLATLRWVAAWVAAMQLVHHWWMVVPAYHRGAFSLHVFDLLIPLALGALWLWEFLGKLATRPLTPAPVLSELEHS